MTDDQIREIREVQREIRKREDEQRKEIDNLRQSKLDPLIAKCDHKYPWGDSAFRTNYPSVDSNCSICGKSDGRY